jgi:hypothetical protein
MQFDLHLYVLWPNQYQDIEIWTSITFKSTIIKKLVYGTYQGIPIILEVLELILTSLMCYALLNFISIIIRAIVPDGEFYYRAWCLSNVHGHMGR